MKMYGQKKKISWTMAVILSFFAAIYAMAATSLTVDSPVQLKWMETEIGDVTGNHMNIEIDTDKAFDIFYEVIYSADDSYAPGEVQIELPRYLFAYRDSEDCMFGDGAGVDLAEIALTDEPTDEIPFVYELTEDTILISNANEITRDMNVSFQLRYVVKAYCTPMYKTFTVQGKIVTPAQEYMMDTLTLSFTSAMELSVSLRAQTQLTVWNSNIDWGDGSYSEPPDFDDYYYYWFSISAHGDTWYPQVFDFNGIEGDGVQVIGYWDSLSNPKNNKSASGPCYRTTSSVISNASRYVLIRFPKENGLTLSPAFEVQAFGMEGGESEIKTVSTKVDYQVPRSDNYQNSSKVSISTRSQSLYNLEELWFGNDINLVSTITGEADVQRTGSTYVLELTHENIRLSTADYVETVLSETDYYIQSINSYANELVQETGGAKRMGGEVYIKSESENEWKLFSTNVSSSLALPAGTVAFKIRWTSSSPITYYSCIAYPVLKADSPSIKECMDITGNKVHTFSSLVNICLYEENGEEIIVDTPKNEAISKCTLSPGAFSNRSATSDVVVENNPKQEQVDISYKVKAMEGCHTTVATGTYQDMIESGYVQERREAVFYELLPQGFVYQSLTAEDINGRAGTVEPEISVIPNYRKSGRTMIIVKVRYTGSDNNFIVQSPSPRLATGFALNIKCRVDWSFLPEISESKIDRAYQVERDMIGSAYPDEGTRASIDVRDIFYNLAEKETVDTGNKNTSYATYYFPEIIVAINSYNSISKTVKSDSDITETYVQTASVIPNEGYVYRLNISAGLSTTEYSDIVFFDLLEEGNWSEWQGVFDFVDTTLAQQQGFAPMVYYSTDSDVEFDLNDDRWSAVIPEDRSLVKAIAVDLSKDTNGKSISLSRNMSVSVFVHMVASELDGNSPRINSNQAVASMSVLQGSEPLQKRSFDTSKTEMTLMPYRSGISVNYKWVSTDNPEGLQPPQREEIFFGTAYIAKEQEITDQVSKFFTFDGWYLDEELSIPFENNMFLSDPTTLYGSWSRYPITVSYEYVSENNPKDAPLPAPDITGRGAAYTAKAVSSDMDYVFSGWHHDQSLNAAFVDGTELEADTTLYGEWIPCEKYYLTVYYMNGSSVTLHEPYRIRVAPGHYGFPIYDIEHYETDETPHEIEVFQDTEHTVYYRPAKYGYSIEYYFDNVLDPDFTEYGTGCIDDVITEYSSLPGSGYELERVENSPLILTSNENENVMRVYFVTALYDYLVEYYFDGKLEEALTECLQAREGEIIGSYPDKVKEYYRLEQVDSLPLTVAAKGENIIRVYYVLESALFEVPATGDRFIFPIVIMMLFSLSSLIVFIVSASEVSRRN